MRVAKLRNYVKKINLGNDKFAYEQTKEAYEAGEEHIKTIERLWTPPKFYFHYQKGGHLAAINGHKRNNCFSKLDLSRFYYQITKNKIIRSLTKIGVPFLTASAIASESTISYKYKHVLPFGFVQSSIISSLVMNYSELGRVLKAKPSHLSLSVYVDDILISGLDCQPDIETYTSQIIEAIGKSNFIINEEKTVVSKAEIEIFNINIDVENLEITDSRMAEFMMEMSRSNAERADAMIRYVRLVNHEQAESLQRMKELRV